MLEISMQCRLLGLLVTLVLGCLAALLAADACAAERARPLLIGALNASWGPTPPVAGLRDGLLALGYRENEDFVIGVRFTQGDVTALPAAARKLVQDKVDIIFADHDEAAKAARQATTEIPIVCVAVGDPVGQGLIQSFARPGGNVTGVSDLHLELGPKRLEVFREIIPGLRHVLFPYHATDAYAASEAREVRAAARHLGMTLVDLLRVLNLSACERRAGGKDFLRISSGTPQRLDKLYVVSMVTIALCIGSPRPPATRAISTPYCLSVTVSAKSTSRARAISRRRRKLTE
jgi:ABC-type uncharacterized transport system substrate-binding protein